MTYYQLHNVAEGLDLDQVKQGFLDALSDYPQLKYILTLQESVAVMAADGYARATQKPTLVQLHSTPGIGNAIGAVYQAKRGHSPLVIIGGDAGIKYMAMDAQMAGDLVGMMEPVTKWSTMVMDSSSLLRVLRRAVKIASTPPMGPVYVCLPEDMLDNLVTEEVFPAARLSTRVAPTDETIQTLATTLAAAQKPMIFVGDGVAYSGAQDELTRVAELLGAEVWEADSGEVNMRYDHPLCLGAIGATGASAAGAGVPDHLHTHVLPRWSGDTNFMTTVAETRVLPEPLDATWAKIRAAWPDASA